MIPLLAVGQACDRLCHHCQIYRRFARPSREVEGRFGYICSKSLFAKTHRLPVVLCQLTSTQQPSKRSDMQHSSLSRHLPSYPQSAPQLLFNRKARLWRNVTGNRHTTRCAAEEGLQFPKWPQQNFRRNLPTPQKLCGVKPRHVLSSPLACALAAIHGLCHLLDLHHFMLFASLHCLGINLA